MGSTISDTHVTYVWHIAPVQKLDDLKTTELIVGAQAPGSTQYDFPMLANQIFGYRFKVVTGYESTPKIHLAMERGEVHGNGATIWTTLKLLNSNWIEEKKVRVLVQWGLKKHPDLPDVPLILDLAKTEADKQALRLPPPPPDIGTPLILPPRAPRPRHSRARAAPRAPT